MTLGLNVYISKEIMHTKCYPPDCVLLSYGPLLFQIVIKVGMQLILKGCTSNALLKYDPMLIKKNIQNFCPEQYLKTDWLDFNNTQPECINKETKHVKCHLNLPLVIEFWPFVN